MTPIHFMSIVDNNIIFLHPTWIVYVDLKWVQDSGQIVCM